MDMKKKASLLLSAAVVLLMAIASFAAYSGSLASVFDFRSITKLTIAPTNQASISSQPTPESRGNNVSEIKMSSVEIPEHILYGRMFTMIVQFKERAEAQTAKGEPTTSFYGKFEREAKLNEWQARTLREVAAAYVDGVSDVDGRAKIIIDQLRLQHRQPILSEDQSIPPSPQLLQLQDERDKLALYHRDNLQLLLGSEKFDELDKFLKDEFSSGFKVLPAPSADIMDEGGRK